MRSFVVTFVTVLLRKLQLICTSLKKGTMEWIFEPWPWYVSGPLIALIMFLLIFIGKQFGMSSNLRGAIIGGFIGANLLSNDLSVAINPDTITILEDLGFNSAGEAYLPTEIYSWEAVGGIKALIILLVGGILIGFGARYAGGCTSGHAISGLSNLQLPSLIAVIGFFIGGLVMVHLLFPLIF